MNEKKYLSMGGWLIVFSCIIIFNLATMVLEIADIFISFDALMRAYPVATIISLIVSLMTIALLIFILITLMSDKTPKGITKIIFSLWINAGVQLAYGIYLIAINLIDSTGYISLFSPLFFAGIWTAYLLQSRRVQVYFRKVAPFDPFSDMYGQGTPGQGYSPGGTPYYPPPTTGQGNPYYTPPQGPGQGQSNPYYPPPQVNPESPVPPSPRENGAETVSDRQAPEETPDDKSKIE